MSLVISIVSHNQKDLVLNLLKSLASLKTIRISKVIVTHNVYEEAIDISRIKANFQIVFRWNKVPLGFGENHNNALSDVKSKWVCILNPDIYFDNFEDPFSRIFDFQLDESIGCFYPEQYDENGKRQDFEREVPTPLSLWLRRVLKRKDRRVDWVSGAFMIFPLEKWKKLNGFDIGYFMYCEDTDICLRTKLNGWNLVPAGFSVVHAAQRASSKNLTHLKWHVGSLIRLWSSKTFWRYLWMIWKQSRYQRR